MEIIIVMAQRKCKYAGEFGPECLACMSEYEYVNNPEFIENAVTENRASGDFDAVEIVRLAVDDKAVDAALFPNRAPIKADVLPNKGVTFGAGGDVR